MLLFQSPAALKPGHLVIIFFKQIIFEDFLFELSVLDFFRLGFAIVINSISTHLSDRCCLQTRNKLVSFKEY